MRMMMTATIEVQSGNEAINNGQLASTMETLMKKLQPESAYFFALDGQRSAQMVFDMKDPSEIPPIAELLFQSLGAEVHFTPVMNLQDLERGLAAWGKSQG